MLILLKIETKNQKLYKQNDIKKETQKVSFELIVYNSLIFNSI